MWSVAKTGFDEKMMALFVEKTNKYSTINARPSLVEGGNAAIANEEQAGEGSHSATGEVYQGGFKPKGKDRSTQAYIPKTPLGMVDIDPEQCAARERVFKIIKEVFKVRRKNQN